MRWAESFVIESEEQTYFYRLFGEKDHGLQTFSSHKVKSVSQKQSDRVSVDVRMGLTLVCVLGLFLMNISLYGQAQDIQLSIEPNWSTFFTGETVTFICDISYGKDSDWYYSFRRDGHAYTSYSSNKRVTSSPLTPEHTGEYQCVGNLKSSTYVIESNSISLTVSDKDVVLETPASSSFEGESVTLHCRHRNQMKEKNAVFYRDGSLIEMDTNHQNKTTISPKSDGSSYTCKFDDEESEPIKLRIKPRPKPYLSKGSPVGGSVTLTCSVTSSSSSSSGWEYFWYRGQKTSELLTTRDDVLLPNGQGGGGGVYRCRGGRGNPVYYTEYSHPVVTNRAVVTVQPDWPEIYSGETITLTCDIKDGGDAEWEYQWRTPSSDWPLNPSGSMIRPSHSGDYRCSGRLKDESSSTEWSDAFTMKPNRPQSLLTVSPSWLSPGDSVTLTCSVEHPSAGWRFFWYQAVPRLSDSYSPKLLPGSTKGTEQGSYIVHGQTHTAGYGCRAGRGDPVFYSRFSRAKFIWSGGSHSAASLTVSPHRLQYFIKDPPSLICEGNSTEWRVRRVYESDYLTSCFNWGTMTGSTCNINSNGSSGVYWCESETGEFSNAVNITIQNGDVILVSSVHPVTEGHSVTLGCRLKTEEVLHNVNFYRNNKLIPNHNRGELNMSEVTKSDEGFYKCEGSDSPQGSSLKSPESWLSVKYSEDAAESSPFPVLLVVGLVCGVSLIILLLLFLYCCRKSKDSRLVRSQSTNQSPATDHMTNQAETQDNTYASPHHGHSCLYETIKGSEEPAHDNSMVTYSVVELRNITKKGKNKEPDESPVYSDLKMPSAADDNLLYAQVHPHTKDKKDEGRSRSAAADETLYSELKPTARDQ